MGLEGVGPIKGWGSGSGRGFEMGGGKRDWVGLGKGAGPV